MISYGHSPTFLLLKCPPFLYRTDFASYFLNLLFILNGINARNKQTFIIFFKHNHLSKVSISFSIITQDTAQYVA